MALALPKTELCLMRTNNDEVGVSQARIKSANLCVCVVEPSSATITIMSSLITTTLKREMLSQKWQLSEGNPGPIKSQKPLSISDYGPHPYEILVGDFSCITFLVFLTQSVSMIFWS